MGWHPDLPDARDYWIDDPPITALLASFGFAKKSKIPGGVDLRDENLLNPPADQSPLQSCCAFAVLDLVEYFERRVLGKTIRSSKLFLAQTVARLENGIESRKSHELRSTSLRSTFKTLARFGAPPEHLWPYVPANFDRAPMDPLLYAYSREYSSIQYFRPVSKATKAKKKLKSIRRFLSAGFPCVCGFSVPSSIAHYSHIPFPDQFHEVIGGQAVLIMGYDDDLRGEGSFLIRGNWGENWGDSGYGWLPYRFVREGFAVDFWSVMKPEWAIAVEK